MPPSAIRALAWASVRECPPTLAERGLCADDSSELGKAVTIVGVCLVALWVAAARSQARPAAAVPCRLSQFAVSLGPYVSEATGQHTLALRLANSGSRTCVLDGYPRVMLYDAAGAIPFVIRHGGDQMISSRPPKAVVVRPGRRAFVVINKYRCDRGAVPGTRGTRRIRISSGTRAAGSASITFGDLHTIPMPYRIPDYCGRGDPGLTLAVSPFVGTVRAALGG